MDPIMLQVGPLALRWYGFFIALGVLVGTLWATRLAERRGLDPEALAALVDASPLPPLPVWETESGLTPAVTKGSLLRHGLPRDMEAAALDQADRLVRVYVSRLSAGVDKWFLYSFSARTGFADTYDMLAGDGHLPAFGPALSNLFWHLEGTVFDQVLPLPGGDGWAYAFAGDGRRVLVVLPDGTGRSTLVGGSGGGGGDSDAVIARDWYGNPAEPGTLGGRPVYLTCELSLQPEAALSTAVAGDVPAASDRP